MISQKKVSIIVPVYNTAKYLSRCLDSILSQDYKNTELIVINDGSTDNFKEIIKKYEVYNNILIINQENRGVSFSRNIGIQQSNGYYVCFVDSDDWIGSSYISKMVSAIESENADICSCSKDLTEEKRIIFSKDELLYQYMKYNKYYLESPCNKLFIKDIFNFVKFNEGRIHEDSYISYKLIEEASTIVCLGNSDYHIEKREGSLTRRKYTDEHYDKVMAYREMSEHYNNTKFMNIAFNRYVGALIFYILKTNRNKCKKNIVAKNEFLKVIENNSITSFKVKFVPFILLAKIGLINYFSLK